MSTLRFVVLICVPFLMHGNTLLAQWVQSNAGLPGDRVIQTFAVSPNGAGGTNLFAGDTEHGVFLSTNNGASWTEVNSGLTDTYVYDLGLDVSGNLFAGTEFGRVFRSTNNGASWAAANTGLTSTNVVYAFAASGTNFFAGTEGNGVFRSTNGGTNWTAVNSGLTTMNIFAFAVSGPNLFAGIPGGVFLSTNNGANWTSVNTTGFFATVLDLAISGEYILAGTFGGVWRRPLSQMVTSVEMLSPDVPMHFNLDQNYPNPFNPVTNFKFSIVPPPRQTDGGLAGRAGNSQLTILKVYDLLGREVATLVNEVMSPGTYTVQWDAAGMASGVYFYRLTTADFVQTRKLVLLR